MSYEKIKKFKKSISEEIFLGLEKSPEILDPSILESLKTNPSCVNMATIEEICDSIGLDFPHLLKKYKMEEIIVTKSMMEDRRRIAEKIIEERHKMDKILTVVSDLISDLIKDFPDKLNLLRELKCLVSRQEREEEERQKKEEERKDRKEKIEKKKSNSKGKGGETEETEYEIWVTAVEPDGNWDNPGHWPMHEPVINLSVNLEEEKDLEDLIIDKLKSGDFTIDLDGVDFFDGLDRIFDRNNIISEAGSAKSLEEFIENLQDEVYYAILDWYRENYELEEYDEDAWNGDGINDDALSELTELGDKGYRLARL